MSRNDSRLSSRRLRSQYFESRLQNQEVPDDSMHSSDDLPARDTVPLVDTIRSRLGRRRSRIGVTGEPWADHESPTAGHTTPASTAASFTSTRHFLWQRRHSISSDAFHQWNVQDQCPQNLLGAPDLVPSSFLFPSTLQNIRQRQRAAIACSYCRKRKVKCSGYNVIRTDMRCSNCRRLDIECVFTAVSGMSPFRANTTSAQETSVPTSRSLSVDALTPAHDSSMISDQSYGTLGPPGGTDSSAAGFGQIEPGFMATTVEPTASLHEGLGHPSLRDEPQGPRPPPRRISHGSGVPRYPSQHGWARVQLRSHSAYEQGPSRPVAKTENPGPGDLDESADRIRMPNLLNPLLEHEIEASTTDDAEGA